MKFRLKKETKPTLATFGKYRAVACHYQTIESEQLIDEVTCRGCLNRATVVNVLSSLSDVIKEHLRQGDKVILHDFGMMKLEIESDKVDDAKEYCASKHIRGVRLHFLPKSSKGRPELYQDIKFEKERI